MISNYFCFSGHLIAMAMVKNEGIPEEEALKKIWMKDSRGLIVKDRPAGGKLIFLRETNGQFTYFREVIEIIFMSNQGLTEHKMPFAHSHEPMKELGDIVKELKPSVLIGAAAVSGVFTKEIIEDMAAFNKRPVIFALSNPTSKAECTAEQVKIMP